MASGHFLTQQLLKHKHLLEDPAAPGLIPSILEKISEEKIVDVAEVNQRRCLEESGQ